MKRRGALVLRGFLGVVLIATGVGKGLDLAGFAAVVGTYEVLPRVLWGPAAAGLSLFEFGLGLWLVSGRRRWLAAVFATLLHCVFLLWASLALLRGLSIDNCGCFGVFWARPLTVWTLVEDGVLLGLCLALARLEADR